jgi:hypothetical protein
LKTINSPFIKLRQLKKILLILLLVICHLAPLLLISRVNNLRTLYSLKALIPGSLYSLNYHSNYKFSKYLKTGSENYNELGKFIKKHLLSNSETHYNDEALWGCSAYSAFNRKGDPIYGRNLDISGAHPALLLYSKAPKGYASVSMVELTVLGFPNNPEALNKKLSSISGRKELLSSPLFPRDGMNEKGLVVATLNAPKQSISKAEEKISIGRWQVIRLLLDNAKDLEEAITLLNKYNIFDGEVHYFIADASGKSSVVEYSSSGMVIINKTMPWQTVTNFLLSNPNLEGSGKDRYVTSEEILKNSKGVLDEYDAMVLLKLLSQPSTIWSILYNQNTLEIALSMNRHYEDTRKFKINSKNLEIIDSR